MSTTRKQIEVEDYGASIAEAIKEVSAAIKNTPLTDRALIVLLADASGVTKTDVKFVLSAVRRLESEYVK